MSTVETVRASWLLLANRDRAVLFALTLARILSNLIDLGAILVFGIIGSVALGNSVVVPLLGEVSLTSETSLIKLMVIAGAMFMVRAAAGIFLTRMTLVHLAKVETCFSTSIARKIFASTLTNFQKTSQSQVEWAVLRSTQKAFSSLLGNALSLLSDLVLAIAIFVVLLIADWLSAMLIVGYFGIVLAAFQVITQKHVRKAGESFAKESVAVKNTLDDISKTFAELRLSGRTPHFLDQLSFRRSGVARAEAMNVFLSSIPRLLLELALVTGALALAIVQFQREDLFGGPDSLGIFVVGGLRMLAALLPLQRSFHQIRYDKSAAQAAQRLLDARNAHTLEAPAEKIDATRDKANQVPASISVSGASFSYQNGNAELPALRDASIQVGAGEFVAVIGRSGSGKTTLLNAILGLIEINSGSVQIDNLTAVETTQAQPGAIGYVPQNPGIISGTILENIALGLSPAEIDTAWLQDVISIVELERFVSSLPKGVNTYLGDRGEDLSIGQMQRIGLARALFTRPRLLVLDEATSSLDAKTEASISSALNQMKGSLTLLAVAHRLSTIQSADRVYLMEKGAIEAEGNFSYLLTHNKSVREFARLLEIQ